MTGATDEPSVHPLPQQTVKISFDPLTFGLRAEPYAVAVVPGTRIFWEFTDLPFGFAPWLRFESDGQHPLGPLPRLSQLSSTLVGEIPPDAVGTYRYRVMMRSRTGTTREEGRASIWSAELTLDVLGPAALAKEATPLVEVRPQGENVLTIEPQVVVLTSATDLLVGFHFSKEILDHATGMLEPRIEFQRFTPRDGRERVSPALGPFSSLIFSGNTIWGSGDAGQRGVYNYQATALRQSTGEVVWASSTDPVIDDQREPPP